MGQGKSSTGDVWEYVGDDAMLVQADSCQGFPQLPFHTYEDAAHVMTHEIEDPHFSCKMWGFAQAKSMAPGADLCIGTCGCSIL